MKHVNNTKKPTKRLLETTHTGVQPVRPPWADKFPEVQVHSNLKSHKHFVYAAVRTRPVELNPRYIIREYPHRQWRYVVHCATSGDALLETTTQTEAIEYCHREIMRK